MKNKHAIPDAVLVNLPMPAVEDDRRQAPGGLVSIATYAATRGHNVEVCDLAGQPPEDLIQFIQPARVIGISTYTTTWHLAVEVAQNLRTRDQTVLLVAGGPHASALPTRVAGTFDYVICGEGEVAFTDLLDAVKVGKTKSLPNIIIATPLEDLDELPFPDYHRFCDLASYTRTVNGKPVICLDSSRGCSSRCRFCNSCAFGRGWWRPRSADRVAAEVEQHVARGYKAIRYNDDNFTVDRQRAMQICKLLQPLGIEFRIFSRAESLRDPELCRVLAAAGCVHIGVGVESLSPRMLGRMGKATIVEHIKEGLVRAHDAGIATRGFFIVGFPGETDTTIDESLEGLRTLALDEGCVYPCQPYPGTDLYNHPNSFGIRWIDPDFSHFVQVGRGRSTGFVMATDSFGPDQVRTWRQKYMNLFEEMGIAWSGRNKGKVV